MSPAVRSRRSPLPRRLLRARRTAPVHPAPAATDLVVGPGLPEPAPTEPAPTASAPAEAAPTEPAQNASAQNVSAPAESAPAEEPAPLHSRVRGHARRARAWATGTGGDAGAHGVEFLGRGGLIAYGVLHLLLAGLAVVLMSTGSSTVHADQEGAIAVIAGIGPVGAALLGLSILGLVAFGVWQVRAALIGFRWVSGGERTRKRIGATGKAIAMFSMASIAFPPAIGPLRGPPPGGPPAPSAPHSVSDLVGTVFALPAGRLVVAAAAAVALGMAVAMCWTGLNATYLGDLHAERLTPRLHRVAVLVGSYGNLARAVLTGSVGILFATAAITGDPSRSGGFTQAMRFIEGEGSGGVVGLVVVAGGLAAYGVYCFIDAYARRA